MRIEIFEKDECYFNNLFHFTTIIVVLELKSFFMKIIIVFSDFFHLHYIIYYCTFVIV